MAEATANPISGLALAALDGRASERLKKVLITYSIVATSVALGKQWYDRARSSMSFTVTVPASDAIYPDVHARLLSRIPEHKRRSLTSHSQRPEVGTSNPTDWSSSSTPLSLIYSGGRQRITLEGHRITVGIERPEPSPWMMKGDDRDSAFIQARENVFFTANSAAGRDAVLRFLQEISDARNSQHRSPNFFIASKWGDWRQRNDIPRRTLGSVVLAAGQKEALVSDLAEFYGRENDYVRMGIPWHRGILLQGPPGSGKTSVAKAIATHFDLDVYFVPLSAVDSDTALLNLVSSVSARRSMLLLEDIDIVNAAQKRSDDQPGITLSGLLNALDGVATPHGLVTVMTTNDARRLDPALTRPGRVDRRERIDHIDNYQVNELVRTFIGPFPPIVGEPDGVAAAAVVEIVKRHLSNPSDAHCEVERLVQSSRKP